ncbi:hypothetical protein WKI13_04265 [Teredinibacter turnerae]|uniref:hypothetical protein n=1 Tax=Teredinibacter turnerae TaxID=2426 RepID=UPI00036FFB85|nr:hypothetical protein [Teredinibacter turnerae]
MNRIVPFKARRDIEVTDNLEAFINWAKITLPKGNGVKAGVRWDADSWSRWNIPGSRVSSLGTGNADTNKLMEQPFRDFAKAVIVNRAIKDGKGVQGWVSALKGLEAGLREIIGEVDVTQTNAAVCDKACDLMRLAWSNERRVYFAGKVLMDIVVLLREKSLIRTPFRWHCQVACPKTPTLKQQKADAKKKLPSDKALVALGEIFHSGPASHLDIMVTSSVALLLSAPARISELAFVPHDVAFREIDPATNESQLYLRWYGAKGFGDKPVPVIEQMRVTCEEAIRRVREITEEGRNYAKWLEEHPEDFPPHPHVPDKSMDEPLSYQEVCDALMLSYDSRRIAPRGAFRHRFLEKIHKQVNLSPKARAILNELMSGFEEGGGRGVYENGKRVRTEFNDTCVVTLRKLNVLLRERYLPRTFPYTNEKRILKFSESLFTVRTGSLNDEGFDWLIATNPHGVMLGCEAARLTPQLSGGRHSRRSIFERWHYPGVQVNSHSFRHFLNTAGQRAGLSDVLVAAWSGRVDVSQNAVYNHETVEERTQAVAQHRNLNVQSDRQQLAEKLRSNQPLHASDLDDLKSRQDRILHMGAFGVCVHDFSESPCEKMGACLTCGKLACIKGDEVRLSNLKVELTRLEQWHEDGKIALHRGDFGAEEWVKKVSEDRLKCEALIVLLENPELDDGTVIWNQDNGWTVTTNALAMKGLLDPVEQAEINKEQPPKLSELKALMGRSEAVWRD